MMLSTYDDSIGTPVMYNYYLWLLAARILYQFVYFSTFAVLVQIIIKMMLNAVKFLFICLLFIIVFTTLANVSFYDISNYSTFYTSLVSTYSNGLGGFDFSSFDASTHISYYSKKVLLAAYLLITVVMLMNFLIAILSETYSTYYGQTLALQMREIIKLRAIYEPNPYYSCLVKAPLFLNAYIILLAPFVVGFKSKRLNKVVVFLEHFIVIILFILGMSVLIIILFPIVCLLFLMQKIIFMNRYSIRPADYFIRILDFFASALVLPVMLSVICIAHIIGETLNLYQTNIIKNVEVYKDEYLYINKIMDVTLPEHDDKLDNHRLNKMYFLFKKFTKASSNLHIVFDPSNCQLSEVFICIMIATLKIVKREFRDIANNFVHDDVIPLFAPTKYVVLELKKNMFIREQFKSFFIGPNYKREKNIDSQRFELLISYLADASLGGTDSNSDQNDLVDDPYKKETGSNYIFLMASMKSHEERKLFWREKLLTIFTEWNEQWILDQFNYAKLFLQLNSFEAEVEDVSHKMITYICEKLESEIPIEEKREIARSAQTKSRHDESWDSPQKDEDDIAKVKRLIGSRGKLTMIDIPSLLYPIFSFEKIARETYMSETKLGTIQLSRKTFKSLNYKNELAVRRFTSSKFSSSHRAFKKMSEE